MCLNISSKCIYQINKYNSKFRKYILMLCCYDTPFLCTTYLWKPAFLKISCFLNSFWYWNMIVFINIVFAFSNYELFIFWDLFLIPPPVQWGTFHLAAFAVSFLFTSSLSCCGFPISKSFVQIVSFFPWVFICDSLCMSHTFKFISISSVFSLTSSLFL